MDGLPKPSYKWAQRAGEYLRSISHTTVSMIILKKFSTKMSNIKRIAIFASYSKDNKIHDYVIYYLRGLRKVVDAIVFVADNDIEPTESAKLDGIVIHAICEKHGCYDFGSYKRGYHWAKTNSLLKNAEELIFCNDSCYGPIFPFNEIFTVMRDCEEDFWGMTHSTEIKEHLQSYFMVFKKNVFSSDTFNAFVDSFEKEDFFIQYVLNYELNLTEILAHAGFKYTSYLKKQTYVDAENIVKDNPTKYPITLLHTYMPFIKKKAYLIDFSSHLKESLEDLHKEISITNTTLYGIINNDIRDYYAAGSSKKNKEWLDIALKVADVKNVIQTLACTAEHNLNLAGDMQWKYATYCNCIPNNTKEIKNRNLIIILLAALCTILATVLICTKL